MKELSDMGAKIHTHTFMPLPLTVFANEVVKEINDKTKKVITKLNSKGLAYGDWIKQEKIANENSHMVFFYIRFNMFIIYRNRFILL